MGDFERVIELKEQAARACTAPSVFRIHAADTISQILVVWDPDRAKSILQEAVKFLPALTPRSLMQAA
jgi:hypothetical protein